MSTKSNIIQEYSDVGAYMQKVLTYEAECLDKQAALKEEFSQKFLELAKKYGREINKDEYILNIKYLRYKTKKLRSLHLGFEEMFIKTIDIKDGVVSFTTYVKDQPQWHCDFNIYAVDIEDLAGLLDYIIDQFELANNQ